ncbi:MAG: sialate O-acetylesterase, partial [Methanothrix sp.]|nr:sialate O-acetylesterase [Methanothrix sp.]
SERPLSVQKGPFKPGYGGELTEGTTFGPDYTFGIYMQKHVKGPILIIKTAWGGRNLLQQFRPPSAGAFEKDKDGHGNPTGYYYNLTVKLVKEVLADPGTYHPGYDKKAGYEIAGFVWFQGFNDLIDGYYKDHKVEGKILYSQYSDLMAAFIRDIRKDLEAPAMPFVIGAMGIDGPIEDTKNSQYWLRQAQLAPADLPEFKGNVAGVRTDNCWDMEWQRISNKLTDAAQKKIVASDPQLKGRALSNAVSKGLKTMASEVLTPEELKLYQVGQSNEAFHYMGSAYTYGKIGKAFAEAMIKMEKK